MRTTGTRANTLELMRRTTVRACAEACIVTHRCVCVFSPQLLSTDADSKPTSGASHCQRNIVPCALVLALVPLTHTVQRSRNHAARPSADLMAISVPWQRGCWARRCTRGSWGRLVAPSQPASTCARHARADPHDTAPGKTQQPGHQPPGQQRPRRPGGPCRAARSPPASAGRPRCVAGTPASAAPGILPASSSPSPRAPETLRARKWPHVSVAAVHTHTACARHTHTQPSATRSRHQRGLSRKTPARTKRRCR